MVKASVAISYD